MNRTGRAAFGIALAALVAIPSIVQAKVIPYTSIAARGHVLLGSIEVSEAAGLGRLELHDETAAVLQRDEGIVALVDVSNPQKPNVLGRYDDDARQSLDGDLAFSTDGQWLFYARQTVQFSLDGVHVIDVSDPTAPSLHSYQPGGGALRIAHYDDGTDEWVVLMDAITGLVVYRFEPTTGVLVPVHASPLPATAKVGGPASAGIVIQEDPIEKRALLYAASGGSGLEVFDFSDPTSPILLGSWADVGLAEIEVRVTGKKRTVFGASEYWFDPQLRPEIVRLDATNLGAIKQRGAMHLNCPAEDRYRVQGMAFSGKDLYAAHSSVGLMAYWDNWDYSFSTFAPFARGARNELAGVLEGPYLFDVEADGDRLYATDAATGILSIIERTASFTRDDAAFNNPTAARKARCLKNLS